MTNNNFANPPLSHKPNSKTPIKQQAFKSYQINHNNPTQSKSVSKFNVTKGKLPIIDKNSDRNIHKSKNKERDRSDRGERDRSKDKDKDKDENRIFIDTIDKHTLQILNQNQN